MRTLLSACLFLLLGTSHAGEYKLRVAAPEYPDQAVLLYRYDDLLTLRTIRLGRELPTADGSVLFTGTVQGTGKFQLRVGDVFADLYMRSGSVLDVTFLRPAPGTPRSLSGTTRTNIVFNDLEPLDINALLSDLNEKLDDVLIEDLATDRIAGMQAAGIVRTSPDVDTAAASRPPTLFLTPDLSAERVDSLERMLLNYYRGIDDPWFFHYLEYGVAGLKHGPRINERELYDRHVKARDITYDDPEQMRFIRSFFAEHLAAYLHRYHEADLKRVMQEGSWSGLKEISARHDFLKDNERLNELVLLDQLYLNHSSKLLVRSEVLNMLAVAGRATSYPEHAKLVGNMLWDLTAMKPGSELPAMRLVATNGRPVDLDSLLNGPVCLFFTASWCTYCELEVAGMEKLQKEYMDVLPIIAISLDRSMEELERYRKLHPGQQFTWLFALDELAVREDLRMRSLPTVLLLNGRTLAHSPAPLPSTGLGALFHSTKVSMQQQEKLKVWDD